MTTTIYVNIHIQTFLVPLVSHFLSNSTLLFLSFIVLISLSNYSTFIFFTPYQ